VNLYRQALRYNQYGWNVLPCPHGWTEPRFDWSAFKTRRAANIELETWLAMDVGLGVILGEISGELTALEFHDVAAYRNWTSRNPRAAGLLPTLGCGTRIVVFFRTPYPAPNGALYLEGWPGRAGMVLGENQFVPLPPTRVKVGLKEAEAVRAAAETQLEVDLAPVASASKRRTPNAERPAFSPTANGQPLTANIPEGTLRWLIPLSRIKIPVLRTETLGVTVRGIAPPETDVFFRLRQVKRDEARAERTRHFERYEEFEGDRYSGVFVSCPDYVDNSEDDDLAWVVENFLPETYLALLAAQSKSGKTCLVNALAMAVAKGEPFLDMPTTKGVVLWVAYEESREERNLALSPYGLMPPNLYFSHEQLYIDSKEGLATLRWWIRKTNARLLIIDPLYASCTAESLAGKARDTLTGLKNLCRDESCAAIVVHHLTKDHSAGTTRERIAESNQLLATASMDIVMETREVGPKFRQIRLSCRGRGSFANRNLVIASQGMADYRLIDEGTEAEVKGRQLNESIVWPLRSAPTPMSAEELADATELPLKTVRNRLTRLQRDKRVHVAGKDGRAALYCLTGTTGTAEFIPLPSPPNDRPDYPSHGPTTQVQSDRPSRGTH
jgi:hypothetical protein